MVIKDITYAFKPYTKSTPTKSLPAKLSSSLPSSSSVFELCLFFCVVTVLLLWSGFSTKKHFGLGKRSCSRLKYLFRLPQSQQEMSQLLLKCWKSSPGLLKNIQWCHTYRKHLMQMGYDIFCKKKKKKDNKKTLYPVDWSVPLNTKI